MSNPDLYCPRCPDRRKASFTEWQCGVCGSPLSWDGPQEFRRTDIDQSASFIWRYAAALPHIPSRISVGEVMTPIASMTISGVAIEAKLESLHATGSFKDRGCALLVSAMTSAGVGRLVEDSSGNAAASLAGYAARAGIPCTIYAPATASSGKLVQAAAYGATVERVEGSRADIATTAAAAHDPANGVIYASHNWHPWFIAGVATWALELWEQRGFRAPAAIVAPAGSGSLILGAYAGYSMLLVAGEIDRMPRLYAAQPVACAPLVAAWTAGSPTVTPVAQQPTIAEGASIANPVRGDAVLQALQATHGGAVGINEPEIRSATLEAAHQGIYIEPTSALAVAATRKLLASGHLQSTEDVVAVLTGNGLKASSTIEKLLGA